MLSKIAEEKLLKYKMYVSERDKRLEEAEEKYNVEEEKNKIISLYSPPINMLACEFANQVIAEMEDQHDTRTTTGNE